MEWRKEAQAHSQQTLPTDPEAMTGRQGVECLIKERRPALSPGYDWTRAYVIKREVTVMLEMGR